MNNPDVSQRFYNVQAAVRAELSLIDQNTGGPGLLAHWDEWWIAEQTAIVHTAQTWATARISELAEIFKPPAGVPMTQLQRNVLAALADLQNKVNMMSLP